MLTKTAFERPDFDCFMSSSNGYAELCVETESYSPAKLFWGGLLHRLMANAKTRGVETHENMHRY